MTEQGSDDSSMLGRGNSVMTVKTRHLAAGGPGSLNQSASSAREAADNE